jgi:hypothetical protein
VGPGRSHGLRYFCGIEVCKDFLNSAEFRYGVDTVCSERMNELILVVLFHVSSGSKKNEE